MSRFQTYAMVKQGVGAWTLQTRWVVTLRTLRVRCSQSRISLRRHGVSPMVRRRSSRIARLDGGALAAAFAWCILGIAGGKASNPITRDGLMLERSSPYEGPSSLPPGVGAIPGNEASNPVLDRGMWCKINCSREIGNVSIRFLDITRLHRH